MSTASPIRARRLRLTRTDECGVPVAEATANSRITRAAFITVGLGADVFRSSDIQVAGADGSICVRSKGVPSLLGYDITIQFCNYDTAVLEMLLGASILTDYTTPVEDVGGVISGAGDFNANTVMVEWWPENGSNNACATGGTNPQRPFMQYIAPRVNRWVVSGNQDFGDAASLLTLTGYAEGSTAYDASRAGEEVTAADIAAMNAAEGVLGWREVTALPTAVAAGYDP
ncbi:MAG: hypothetical protein ACRBK7_14465 [Acidimicrobiales bacterium]